MRKSSVPQRAATSEKFGQYESRYHRTVFGTGELSSRVIALLTRESKIGKRPPLMKWSSVVVRDSPNRFSTGPSLYLSVYFLSDQASKNSATRPSSGHF